MTVTLEKTAEMFDATVDNGCACYPNRTKIMAALLKAQGEIAPIVLDAKNPHFKNEYATLNALLRGIKKPCHDAGIVPQLVSVHNGLLLRITHVASGEHDESFVPIPPQTDPQKYGGWLTYGSRYLIRSMFCIEAPDPDDDGNTAPTPRPAPRGNAPEKSPATRGGVSVAEIKRVEAKLEAATVEELVDNKDAFEQHIAGWGAEADKLRKKREDLIRKKSVAH